ncbi:hypothetical protein QUF66_00500, partial [Bacillus licheniformis]|uniref:hypothetical protein n=8 Tax=Bacillaceae TaxID=186817 RepID=UPI0025A1A969
AASRFPLKCPITCICKLPGLPLAIPETTAAMFLVISSRVNDDRKTLKQAEKLPFGHISADGKDTLKRILLVFSLLPSEAYNVRSRLSHKRGKVCAFQALYRTSGQVGEPNNKSSNGSSRNGRTSGILSSQAFA